MMNFSFEFLAPSLFIFLWPFYICCSFLTLSTTFLLLPIICIISSFRTFLNNNHLKFGFFQASSKQSITKDSSFFMLHFSPIHHKTMKDTLYILSFLSLFIWSIWLNLRLLMNFNFSYFFFDLIVAAIIFVKGHLFASFYSFYNLK